MSCLTGISQIHLLQYEGRGVKKEIGQTEKLWTVHLVNGTTDGLHKSDYDIGASKWYESEYANNDK